MNKHIRLLFILILFSNAFLSFADENTKSGKRWALVIGINNYQSRFIEPLSMPCYDAKLIEDTLKNEGKFDIVIRMTDDIFPSSPKYPSKKFSVASAIFVLTIIFFYFSPDIQLKFQKTKLTLSLQTAH